MTDSDKIGERWKETLERVLSLLDQEHQLREHECRFLTDTRGRLETYEEDTMMSAKQLNWITVLEDKVGGVRT